jgi:hypothetical protein
MYGVGLLFVLNRLEYTQSIYKSCRYFGDSVAKEILRNASPPHTRRRMNTDRSHLPSQLSLIYESLFQYR